MTDRSISKRVIDCLKNRPNRPNRRFVVSTTSPAYSPSSSPSSSVEVVSERITCCCCCCRQANCHGTCQPCPREISPSPLLPVKSRHCQPSTRPRLKSSGGTLFTLLVSTLLLLALNPDGRLATASSLPGPQTQRGLLSHCLFGSKPVKIYDADNYSTSQWELFPASEILAVEEDAFSQFILRSNPTLAKYLHIAVVANLSNNVLALHESKLNVSVAVHSIGEDGTPFTVSANAEPLYQRYCDVANSESSSHVIPCYSWMLAPDRNNAFRLNENSTATWIISWQGPTLGRSYSINLHVFAVSRDRTAVTYLHANESVRGVNIDYDCDTFTVRDQTPTAWNPAMSSLQFSATPIARSIIDGQKTSTLTIEDSSKRFGIQGFLATCSPWNGSSSESKPQNAVGKWYLADDGSTMARRSECPYSSFREFDRRRKFVVKLVYSPPMSLDDEIFCQSLVLLGDGTLYLVQLPGPLSENETAIDETALVTGAGSGSYEATTEFIPVSEVERTETTTVGSSTTESSTTQSSSAMTTVFSTESQTAVTETPFASVIETISTELPADIDVNQTVTLLLLPAIENASAIIAELAAVDRHTTEAPTTPFDQDNSTVALETTIVTTAAVTTTVTAPTTTEEVTAAVTETVTASTTTENVTVTVTETVTASTTIQLVTATGTETVTTSNASSATSEATTVTAIQPAANESIVVEVSRNETANVSLIALPVEFNFDYDCNTMMVKGSNVTPKYLINGVSVFEGNGNNLQKGPFAMTFLPASIGNVSKLSVILQTHETNDSFRGFFVKCGSRFQKPRNISSEEDPLSKMTLEMSGHRSVPFTECSAKLATAKQADYDSKVEQILFIDLPNFQADVVVTCWATLVVNESDYWIISGSMPLKQGNNSGAVENRSSGVNQTTIAGEFLAYTTESPRHVETTTAISEAELNALPKIIVKQISNDDSSSALFSSDEESRESAANKTTTRQGLSPSPRSAYSDIDCSALTTSIDYRLRRRLTSRDTVAFFNLSTTMALLPNAVVDGALIFSADADVEGFVFACFALGYNGSKNAVVNTSAISSLNVGTIFEVVTYPANTTFTSISKCGSNYRRQKPGTNYLSEIKFAWHLPDFIEASSGICRAAISLANGTLLTRQSRLIELVNQFPTTTSTISPQKFADNQKLQGFPASMTCGSAASKILSPKRFRDCFDCGIKEAALEFLDSSIKVGGNMTIGIVSTDSEFVITDFVLSCYVESTGQPLGSLYEAPILANFLPGIFSTVEAAPLPCRRGAFVRNHPVLEPQYEMFFVWSLPENIPMAWRRLRCSAMFPMGAGDSVMVIDSVPLHRVGPVFKVPINARPKPQSDDYEGSIVVQTTTTPRPTLRTTTVMKFRILPHMQGGEDRGVSRDMDFADPHSRFIYDCFEFAVRLPPYNNKTVQAGSRSSAPYAIHLSSDKFHDGQSLQVMVNASKVDARPFRGFMVLCAHVFGVGERAAFRAEAPAGRLVETLVDGRVLSAAGGCGSRVEVSAKQLKKSVAFLWKAPVFSEFPVQCRAIIIENESTYWILEGPVMHLLKPTTKSPETTISHHPETTVAAIVASSANESDNGLGMNATTLPPSTDEVVSANVSTTFGGLDNSSSPTTVLPLAETNTTPATGTSEPPGLVIIMAPTRRGENSTDEVVAKSLDGPSPFMVVLSSGDSAEFAPTTTDQTSFGKVKHGSEKAEFVKNVLEAENLIAVESSEETTPRPRWFGTDEMATKAMVVDITPAPSDLGSGTEGEAAAASPPLVDDESIALEIFQPNPIAAETVPAFGTSSTAAPSAESMSSGFFSRGFDCRRDGHFCRFGGDSRAKCDRLTGKCICSRSFSGYDCSISEVLPNSMCNQGRGCLNGGICGRRYVHNVVIYGDKVLPDKCFCPYDYMGEHCEIPRVSAQCDAVDGMRVIVVPFSLDPTVSQQYGGFSGSVRVVSSTSNKTDSPTNFALPQANSECNFKRLPESGVYVLERSFSHLIDNCGARITENKTVYLQFMIQYSAFDLLTAFDPVYLVYCDLSSAVPSTMAPTTQRTPSRQHLKKKADSGAKFSSEDMDSDRVKMYFSSKVAVSGSLDSLPRQVIIGSANTTRTQRIDDGPPTTTDYLSMIKHNMSFVIRKRSQGGHAVSGSTLNVDEIRLTDVLEIEISNHDTSYFKYIYLDECQVDFDYSKQPGVTLISDGCPTLTIRRYLVDWMKESEALSNGELVHSAMGVASNDSDSATSSALFAYSAFWPADARALSFNCSVHLCAADAAEDCPKKLCPSIPGFTFRHRRRRREATVAETQQLSPDQAQQKQQQGQRKPKSKKNSPNDKPRTGPPGRRKRPTLNPNANLVETGWNSIWLCILSTLYIAVCYLILMKLFKFLRFGPFRDD